MSVSEPERPNYSELGKRGMASRWGNPANRRVVRIADLSPEQRALVLALVSAAKSATPEEDAA